MPFGIACFPLSNSLVAVYLHRQLSGTWGEACDCGYRVFSDQAEWRLDMQTSTSKRRSSPTYKLESTSAAPCSLLWAETQAVWYLLTAGKSAVCDRVRKSAICDSSRPARCVRANGLVSEFSHRNQR